MKRRVFPRPGSLDSGGKKCKLEPAQEGHEEAASSESAAAPSQADLMQSQHSHDTSWAAENWAPDSEWEETCSKLETDVKTEEDDTSALAPELPWQGFGDVTEEYTAEYTMPKEEETQEPCETGTASKPRQQMSKKDLTAADIIQRIKTGDFESLAERMEIGIRDSDWERMYARTAVVDFLRRYNNNYCEQLFYFELQRAGHGCHATLVTRGFYNRRFESGFSTCASPLAAKRAAEQAACQAFKLDLEVNEVRRRLPPSMKDIRNFFALGRVQKEELRALGFDSASVQLDIMKSIYNGLRKLGCLTSLWDRNSADW
ncbi:unnamed protein product [Symbiodinium natans]|uniref:Uncharacterized protein n=1 Tax=Symbiodinium natans TaxID=878477 RepID=A0A812KJ90_9DINO|nr:unnamed protein product [Symbiodinium natans]